MSEYFTHDFKARHDPKIINLIMRHGMTGVGIYWCLIEMLHEEGGYISLSECERIAFELRTDIDKIKSVIYDFELFKNDDKIMYSESALLRIEIRKNKSTKASESANARWDKAKAMRTQCDGNAKKKSKVNEIKVKNKEFTPPTLYAVENYFIENGYDKTLAKTFFDGYSVNDWKDSHDKKITNWKQKAIQVWFKDKDKKTKTDRISVLDMTPEEQAKAQQESYDKFFE
jgi:hypothetical protein